MRVVITGVTGLLGKYLFENSPPNFSIFGISKSGLPNLLLQKNFTYSKINVEDTGSLFTYLHETRPDTIIHLAGEGSVDKIQGNIGQYQNLNEQIPSFLAKHCVLNDIKFIYISSNAVFGQTKKKISDYDSPFPINDYGLLKSRTESRVASINNESLIVRPILMYGKPLPNRRSNLVMNWIESLSNLKPVDVVSDVLTEPLFARDCADIIWKLIKLDASGPVNVSGGVLMSLYDFAILTCEVFGLDQSLINSVKLSSLTQIAPRPNRTSYDLKRLIQDFHINPLPPISGLSSLFQELNIEKGESRLNI
jgi:dTDP-4-dehydrorhamnose reductase